MFNFKMLSFRFDPKRKIRVNRDDLIAQLIALKNTISMIRRFGFSMSIPQIVMKIFDGSLEEMLHTNTPSKRRFPDEIRDRAEAMQRANQVLRQNHVRLSEDDFFSTSYDPRIISSGTLDEIEEYTEQLKEENGFLREQIDAMEARADRVAPIKGRFEGR